jgi:uncharacterized coiled-coil protein SlyX
MDIEPYEQELFTDQQAQEKYARMKRQVLAALVALLGLAGITMSYGVHERNQVEELTTQAANAKTSTDQLQAQVKTLTARLNDLTAAQAVNASGNSAPAVPLKTSNAETADDVQPPAINTPAFAAPSGSITPTPKPMPPKRAATRKRPSAVDKQYALLKAQVDDQQKQLKETQDELAKNRADLEGSISSTRDELNGSIAKTHDELVTLEKRGERSYFEFDLTKNKSFQRVGPMSLSLRKSDTKHKSYDLALMVDDDELNKKRVNLFEPVWIDNGGQAVQIVVNRITKDAVHGYVSSPKYKESELATMSTANPGNAAPDQQAKQQVPQK